MTKEKLKPCPLCLSNDVYLQINQDSYGFKKNEDDIWNPVIFKAEGWYHICKICGKEFNESGIFAYMPLTKEKLKPCRRINNYWAAV